MPPDPALTTVTSANKPGPWPPHVATASVVSAVGLRLGALKLPESATRRELTAGYDNALNELIDDYCGTPPRPLPALALAIELVAFAEDLDKGELQTALLKEASRIAQKGFGAETAKGAKAGRG